MKGSKSAGDRVHQFAWPMGTAANVPLRQSVGKRTVAMTVQGIADLSLRPPMRR